MLKLASKFAMDIFPSVIATIIGAYIVNHYINTKTPADTTAPAAAVSTVDPKKASAKADSKPAEKSGDLANIPEPGVRAKGISEKSITDRSPTEKAAEKPSEKADRPSETASIPPVAPAETGNRHKVTREKAASKPVPAPAAEPVVAAPVTAPAAEPAANGPDANDLARAAIERLRGSEPAPAASRAPETSREVVRTTPAEPPRVVAAPPAPSAPQVPVATAPAANAPALQPLPPPILVSTPPAEQRPANPAVRRTDDPLRPTPPADIPDPGAGAPLDLRADAASPPKRPSVAEDVLSAAKSMFHSVLPKP